MSKLKASIFILAKLISIISVSDSLGKDGHSIINVSLFWLMFCISPAFFTYVSHTD